MATINIRSVALINGMVVCAIAVAMFLTLLFDIIFCSGKCVDIFAPSILASVFLGGATILSCKSPGNFSLSRNETFLLVVSLWGIVSIVSAFPFYVYKGVKLTFISALFESASGITTTGATVYPDVEILPRALNMWRCVLQFFGGVGVVAIGMVVLPILKIGGMQLFLTEHPDKAQKFLPRVSQIAGLFVGTYVAIIMFFTICLKLCGMNLFDSVCHSVSAISTTGSLFKNEGIDWYHSGKIQIVISCAMFVGGLTFIEIVKCFKTDFRSFLKSQQTRGYLKIVIVATLIPVILSIIGGNEGVTSKKFCDYIFQVMSAITTTGFDFSKTYNTPQILIFVLAIIGGCSGSTAGGIKIFRIQILYAIVKHQIHQMVHPLDVNIPKYQGQRINESLIKSVISFFWLLIISFVVSVALVNIISGNDSIKCCCSVVSCLFNLGYDMEFSSFHPLAKIILVVDMIIGRLEIIPIFIIFSRAFWRR